MMRRFFAILIISVLAVVIPNIAFALSPQQVNQIATQVTVLIDGYQSGSGVIFKRIGNVYSVLTAKHVVNAEDVIYLVITPDGERHQTESTNVQPINGVDLAVAQFTSDKIYQVAQLGNSDQATNGSTVYVAGAPEPNETIPQRTVIVTPGSIVGVQKPQDGYALIYTNPTRRGMSGGPVLNEAGEVIGIHGQGDQQDGSKSGLNLAIPIKTFLTSQAPPTVSPVVPSPQTAIAPSPSPKKQLTEEQKRKAKAAQLKKEAIAMVQQYNVQQAQPDNIFTQMWSFARGWVKNIGMWVSMLWCLVMIVDYDDIFQENDFWVHWSTVFLYCLPGFFVFWWSWII
ncbi:serine protease [Microcoleus sp. A006_D1]|uniref:S1 family peptidase n=1 Tax=Microcoleus sp. A006_D1 TaxID=3055267 RepID=UPI002FCE9EEA